MTIEAFTKARKWMFALQRLGLTFYVYIYFNNFLKIFFAVKQNHFLFLKNMNETYNAVLCLLIIIMIIIYF